MCWFLWFTFQDKKLLEDLSLSLKPRAIDRDYYYYNDNLSFYHAHLSISDLHKDTSQPYVSKQGTVVGFVWEVYNKEFLLWLLEKEWDYTELEVISFMYEWYGEEFIHYINGEFAIFIYDPRIDSYFLFRDRWGTNNIYYTFEDGKLYFASEIKALIRSNPELNKRAFIEHMTFQFSISPNTIVEGILTLRPATFLVFSWGSIEVKNFREYIPQENHTTIISAIESAVVRRIPTFQDKIFLSLSGWPDSNLLLYFLSKYYKWEIIAYSFESEKNSAEIVIAKSNTTILWVKHLIINTDWEEYQNIHSDIYVHEWLVNLPNLWSILKKKYPEYSNIKVEFWWDGKEELILGNNHFPYKEILSRYEYFRNKLLIKEYQITQEFLNKEMFDYNLQMIDKLTLRNGIERRMPFTDYELLKFFRYWNYRNEAKEFLQKQWLNIVDWEYWYNLGIGFENLYDTDLVKNKDILFEKFSHERSTH